ncbi:hypothetical protein M422DRAFT_35116 [Sphaerobolus stellatus SS14]|uniref:DUF6699 domain-containing protein n=1 Tax=Sphaerobolus stellatus (strain SS14) TaxID=990650 RepID=A0A0C9VA96_SPHS4|nr:hypothetical protein M422DRAFT_35116 [Sphaerobolus stellatus SS14]
MVDWFEPFGSRPLPFARVPRDSHGHPRRHSEASRHQREATRHHAPMNSRFAPVRPAISPGVSRPPPLWHRNTEPIFQYPQLISPPGQQADVYHSSVFRPRFLSDPEWSIASREDEWEECIAWEDWPLTGRLPLRYGPNGVERRHVLHPFLAANLPCHDISSSIWDILDLPTAPNALFRWTSVGLRLKVADWGGGLETVATYPPVERMIIHCGEEVPPLEISRAAEDKQILMKDVLLAIYKHLNGNVGLNGEGGSYIPQDAFNEFHEELRSRTEINCNNRRKFLYSRQDARRRIEPPKWIDTLGLSATKFVRLSIVREIGEGVIICELITCPGKIVSSEQGDY